MGSHKLIPLLSVILVCFVGCSSQRGSGDIVYAGWNDLFVIDIAGGEIVRKVALGAQINDLEPTGDGRLLLATTRGLLVVNISSMEVEETVPLGILDSVEYDEGRDLVYALSHPGTNPSESGGPHKLIKLSGDGYEELGNVFLEPWTFDIFLNPSGEQIFVTHMAGRAVMKIDTESMTESDRIWFGEGGEWEGRMVLLRHLAFSGDGSRIYLIEQGEASPTSVWIYSPESGEMENKSLAREARVQGMVTSADGSRIFANGLDELIVLNASGEEIGRTELGAEHRWIALSPDGSTLYLTADTGEDEGLITCVDIQSNVVREIKVPTPLNVLAVHRDDSDEIEGQTKNQ